MNIVHDQLTSDDHRTVKKIEEGVTKKMERNRLSMVFHARNDKEAITSWRSDLTRILAIFNVCSVVYVWLLLTVHSQAEVAINTNANTSAIHCDVMSTQTTVSSIQHGVTSTHTLVSNIYHNMLQSQGEMGDQHHSVSIASNLSTACSPSPRLKPGQWSQIPCNS